MIVFWIPIAAVLTLTSRPTLDPSIQQCVVFFVAIWGAYLVRSLLLWVLGMVTFWTTRVSALYTRRTSWPSCSCPVGWCR